MKTKNKKSMKTRQDRIEIKLDVMVNDKEDHDKIVNRIEDILLDILDNDPKIIECRVLGRD